MSKSIIGKRIRLLDVMRNPNSTWIPVEDLPVGLEGDIVDVTNIGDDESQISVKWDNGRSLAVLSSIDKYEIF